MTNNVDYDYLNECILNNGMDQIASECHGNLTGVICCQCGISAQNWLDNLFLKEKLIDRSSQSAQIFSDLLLELYYDSERLLNTMNFEFELFLPDDETEIKERLDALGEWCSGFLLGLALGGVSDIKNIPEEMLQFLKDCLDIARVANTELDNSEQDETVYSDLVEYIRMGAISLFEEIYQIRNNTSESNDESVQ